MLRERALRHQNEALLFSVYIFNANSTNNQTKKKRGGHIAFPNCERILKYNLIYLPIHLYISFYRVGIIIFVGYCKKSYHQNAQQTVS